MIEESKLQIALVGGDSATRMMLSFLLEGDSCDVDVVDLNTFFASVPARAIDLFVVILSGRKETDIGLLAWLRRGGGYHHCLC